MTTAEKYRQLEKSPLIDCARVIFEEIRQKCPTVNVGDVLLDIRTGKTPSKLESRFFSDDFIGWFKPDEIGSAKYLFEANAKLSKYAVDSRQVTVYEPYTILINAIGDVGRISVLREKASSNQQITGIRFNELIDTEFAYYYFVANRHYFYVDLFQTTLPIVNQKKIVSIPILLPPIELQRSIASGLECLESVSRHSDLSLLEALPWEEPLKAACRRIFEVHFLSKEISNQLTHQQTLVKQLRQQLLQEAVQGKLSTDQPIEGEAALAKQYGKLWEASGPELLAHIRAEKAKLVKEKKIKADKPLPPITAEEMPFELPEGWVWVRGEVVAEYIDPQPSHRTPPESSDGVPYIAMGDIAKDNTFKFDKARKVSFEVLKEHRERYELRKGDFIFGKIGTIGKPVKLVEPFKYTLSANLILIQPNRVIINHDFLFHFLCSPTAEQNLFDNRSTMSYPVFGMGKARKMPIPLPPIRKQYQIVREIDLVFSLCDSLETQIQESLALNAALLQEVLREALGGGE